MIDSTIIFSNINDFLFCPVSIYFHNLMGKADKMLTQSHYQINGTHAHQTIEDKRYSSRSSCLQGIDVYCEEYGITGKIDIFDVDTGILTERKKKISQVYEGQIFQTYAQYFALTEMGYVVKRIRLYSMDNNKNHEVKLPMEDPDMKIKFENTLRAMHIFDPSNFKQTNVLKCSKCIYEPICGSSCLEGFF